MFRKNGVCIVLLLQRLTLPREWKVVHTTTFDYIKTQAKLSGAAAGRIVRGRGFEFQVPFLAIV